LTIDIESQEVRRGRNNQLVRARHTGRYTYGITAMYFIIEIEVPIARTTSRK
jgi:hypothetical protein